MENVEALAGQLGAQLRELKATIRAVDADKNLRKTLVNSVPTASGRRIYQRYYVVLTH